MPCRHVARHALQRPSVLSCGRAACGVTRARRPSSPGRSDSTSPRERPATDVNASPTATSASNNSAPFTNASSTYSPTIVDRSIVLSRSGRRKATGTFYTPRTITEYLVRRTLSRRDHDADLAGAAEAARARPCDGERRVPGCGVPLHCRRLRARPAAGGSRLCRGDRRRGEGWLPAHDRAALSATASIEILRRCSSRACRCGSRRWPPIGR